ncbi:MAG: helix-turn-helix domain-containing protein, partial [Thermoanaerobaculia bacterium]
MPERVPSPPALEVVADPRRAIALMHPTRLRILHQACEPTSATQAAGRLGLSRQRVNHHFRHLILTGFLRPAGRRRRRNMVEKLYVASAAGYLLSPELLGPARADWRGMAESRRAEYLLALLAHAQADVAPGHGSKGTRSADTLALKTQFRLEGAGEREEFAA